MTESLARKLKLPCRKEDRAISGISQMKTSIRKVTDLRVESTRNDFTTTLECLVLPSITEDLPQKKINVKSIILPKDISLADPVFNEPGSIDLLIGAGLYWKLLLGKAKNRIEGQPALQNTRFGWIIGGEMSDTASSSTAACLFVSNDILSQQVEQFWRQESIPEKQHFSNEERACEEYFEKTVRRDKSGRFIIRLPKREKVALGDSRDQAYRRLISLERRLSRNCALKSEYVKFIDDYIERGHMSLLQTSDEQETESYFLPHQAVIRPDSVTTKVRVVFDASAKTTLGTALNDKLMTGPNLQRELIDIVLRFRIHEYVVTGDVAMMFRQILVDDRDRALQRILWRGSPEERVKVFELNTVTYGTACAPYLAIRCLRQLAIEHYDEFPRAAKAIMDDCYMDDVLTGAKSVEDAIDVQKQLSQLLMRDQFELRKWRSNNPQVLQHLSEGNKTDKLLVIDKEGALKTLGLLWDAKSDCLQYRIEVHSSGTVTKRLLLSKVAQVFDPLGLIAPLLINGKIIMQQLWAQDIDWDQPIPEDLRTAWETYYKTLPRINEMEISRNITPAIKSERFHIFGFGDASEKAFGACLYAVSVDIEDKVQSHLICAKSKVAPLRTISLPRLELEASLLLARLYDVARNAYGNRIDEVKMWSDSTIVLGWVKTQPNNLKTFVANRVSKIQDLTENIPWHHVPSEENPADLISRGVTVDTLKQSKLWWHGPDWLTSDSQWPVSMEEPEETLPELKTATKSLTVTEESDVLTKFQSYGKLKRVISYCIRFKNNALGDKKTGPITVDESERAEKAITRMVQQEAFAREIKDLREDRELASKSKLRSLDPFLDEEGLIRVGGRLRYADLSNQQKHPLVLPPRHHVTSLIIRDEHVRLHHCPSEQLLGAVRHRFWPLSGRREVRKVIKSCLNCFRFKPTVPGVKMGDLPIHRVSAIDRPFTNSGVDYAGPLQVRESRRRGRVHVSKAYVAVFTSLSTKAIHLELVSDLTTEAFLAALSRFTARRGICSQIFSDNGTNFVGAARELKDIYAFLEKEYSNIEISLAKQRIEWHFIPPRAPHFGGIWEAAVKITKRHLYTVTQGKILTFEECSTVLTEIEAILNSRPLTPLSSDPIDLEVLTPSHFLIGGSLIQPVQNNYLELPENRLSRWQHIQRLKQQFWSRWQSEYLHELQKRTKWTTTGENIELGTMVLLKDDHAPPLQWALGRVTALYPEQDGIVRVVAVKTQNGEFKRAVKKLCPIPMDKMPED